MRRIVQVALPLPLFRTFSYAVPPDLQDKVFPGSTVEVGFHGRVLTGWVVKEGGEELPGLKEIRDVLPFPPFPPSLLGFSQRLSLLYLSPLGEVLASFFPPLGKSAKKYLGFRVFAGENIQECCKRFGVLPPRGMNLFLFLERFRVPAKDLERFLKEGILRLEREFLKIGDSPRTPGECFFWEIPHLEERKAFLRDILVKTWGEGKKALLLFPDFQKVDVFCAFLKECFPSMSLIRYDSRLRPKERVAAFWRIVEGDFDAVVGTRLPAFVFPCRDLGLSVLFDPEEKGYVADRAPHYDIGEVMEERAHHFGECLHIVCALPSLRVYFRWKEGRVKPGGITPPSGKRNVQGVVARGLWRNFALFPPVRRAITSVVERKGIVLVWVQKTGYATALGCRECGFYYTCPSCGIALRYHKDLALLVCPLCHFRLTPESTCPSCGGIQWGEWGQGVERVFEEVQQTFPGVLSERVDPEIEEEGWGGKVTAPSILVGTSALLREDLLPRVSLFVVHSLDEWLSLPEIGAWEQLYIRLQKVLRLLPQDAQVLVQGSQESLRRFPEFLKPWSLFYADALEKRRSLRYPPFVRLVRFVVRARNKEAVFRVLSRVRELFEARGIQVLGPFPSVRPRRERAKSAELIVRYPEEDAAEALEVCAEVFPLSGMQWSFEFVLP